jgi:hypothetical protein
MIFITILALCLFLAIVIPSLIKSSIGTPINNKLNAKELSDAGLYNPENIFERSDVEKKIDDMIAPGGFERWIKNSEGKESDPINEEDKMRLLLGLKNKKK